jgi:lipopolysaccharide/colanic/teichoic acid biosynthesis glycosyltransferase
MTAESQIGASKALRSSLRRGLWPLLVSILDGALVKRAFDIVFSLTVLILFSPLYLSIIFLITLSSPGPVFYVQERIGKNYKPFGCIKFRTMVRNADEMLLQLMENSPQLRREYEGDFKLRRDPRVTFVGQFLRITSLDEFPQFFNVLRGDMSVVGPRPVVDEEIARYGRYADRVLSIRPGITGLWQVSGRNDVPYPRRVQLDLYYVNNRNLGVDLWIIIKTIGVVLFPKGNGAY